MSETKLKPCPFCGRAPFVYKTEKHKTKVFGETFEYGGGTFIECSNCTCAINAEAEEDAVKAWNTRTTPDCEVDDGK